MSGVGWGGVRSSVVSEVGVGVCQGICCEWGGVGWGCVRASVVSGGVGVCQIICCEWGGGVSDHLL